MLSPEQNPDCRPPSWCGRQRRAPVCTAPSTLALRIPPVVWMALQAKLRDLG